jgi:hypothetical protein
MTTKQAFSTTVRQVARPCYFVRLVLRKSLCCLWLGSIRPSVEIDAAHEGEIAAYAVAGNEVGIADDALQVGEADEIAVEGDVAGEEVPF